MKKLHFTQLFHYQILKQLGKSPKHLRDTFVRVSREDINRPVELASVKSATFFMPVITSACVYNIDHRSS